MEDCGLPHVSLSANREWHLLSSILGEYDALTHGLKGCVKFLVREDGLATVQMIATIVTCISRIEQPFLPYCGGL